MNDKRCSYYYVGNYYERKEKKCAFTYINVLNENGGISLKHYSGVSECSTQNEADLITVYNALIHAYKNKCKEATIYSTSTYVVNAIGREWIFDWKKDNWKTKQGKEVKFLNIWKKVYSLIYEKGLNANMKWIRSPGDSIMIMSAVDISENALMKDKKG